ncbi:MAG: tetratricopeptide repeat protein, partial [Acidobacteriota bacterium]
LLTLLARFDAAEEALNKSLELSRLLEDRAGERNALRSVGFMRWHQGKNEEAISMNEKALSIDRERGDTEAVATDLTNLGSVLRNHGNHAAALKCLEEALQLYDQIEDPVKHAAALHLSGNVHRDLGNSEEAMHYMQAAMAVSTRYKLVIMQSFHLTSLANMCWQQGKMKECLDMQKKAVEINRKSRYADGLANSLRMVGETLQNMERDPEALPYFQEAASLFSSLKDYRNESHLWSKIALIHENQSLWSEALQALEKLKGLYEFQENRTKIAETAEQMAALSRKQGNIERAIGHYREAIQAREMLGQSDAVAGNLNSVGILEWQTGNYAAALEDYQKALEIFQSRNDEVHEGLDPQQYWT